ncbi:hypothetical protein OG698_44865 [Streptomyces sp. NBC_01003]|uniref:hypothetical protein n=1 Tax=Streptomyces sp. NBC_01003 TaxID=2903714 RepID=UPI00386B4F7C|nr:hypothetical protein OG698_44865 [Streptomyces sp. NBC_01003]
MPYKQDLLVEVAAACRTVTDWHPRRRVDPAAAQLRSKGFPQLSTEDAAVHSA